MLLILSAISLQKRLGGGPDGLSLLDLPVFAREHLDLNGLLMPTTLLTGLPAAKVDRLRDNADKCGCPCLVLQEVEPQALADDGSAGEAAIERMQRVLQAALRLGCNSVAMPVAAPDTDDAMQAVSDNIKRVLEKADRIDLNVLLSPHKGLTSTPDRLAALIKKVGGFRIGSLPDFQTAAKTGKPAEYLRKVTPYASSVVASTVKFNAAGAHEEYDLGECVEAVLSVGFDGAMAIEYRGKGDAVEGVKKARDLLRKTQEDPADADLDDALGELDLGEDEATEE